MGSPVYKKRLIFRGGFFSGSGIFNVILKGNSPKLLKRALKAINLKTSN